MKKLLSTLFAVMLCAGTALAQGAGQVVVYTALDKQFSEPILKDFEAATGITVRPVYDTEAVKTVGLVNRLLSERARPRADVFWNNEIIRSIQLKNEGLTEAYVSPVAADIPESQKDPEGHWTGFAARGRVILVNKDLLPDPADWPRNASALTDPKWKGKATYAKPLFGTTNTHAAVIWAMAGEEAAKEFWAATFANAVMMPGNAQARDAVAAGEAAWCWTDTDDAYGAIADGRNVEMIYPEADPAGKGVLMMPNTLVLIKNSPNPDNGRKLIDYLLSREVEAKLAASRSAQIPVREGVTGPSGITVPAEEDVMVVDWAKVYDALSASTQWLEETISRQ